MEKKWLLLFFICILPMVLHSQDNTQMLVLYTQHADVFVELRGNNVLPGQLYNIIKSDSDLAFGLLEAVGIYDKVAVFRKIHASDTIEPEDKLLPARSPLVQVHIYSDVVYDYKENISGIYGIFAEPRLYFNTLKPVIGAEVYGKGADIAAMPIHIYGGVKFEWPVERVTLSALVCAGVSTRESVGIMEKVRVDFWINDYLTVSIEGGATNWIYTSDVFLYGGYFGGAAVAVKL